MNKDQLKAKVCQAIDENRDRIIAIGEDIYAHPQLGYKEFYAADLVKKEFESLGLEPQDKMAVSGVQARARGGSAGPVIAVMGELDAVICHEHPAADPVTGAIHACGHHAQVAAMMGVAIGMTSSGVMADLAGELAFMAVPAEEYVELAYRSTLREKGEIAYFGGKQELIRQGYLDDVDMAMMIHSLNLPESTKVVVGGTGNGFVGKNVQFIGKEAHAGAAPEQGVNALNAAMIAINNIHVQRETFADEERVRVHPIITKGGDIVNVVPADVRMETYVRARTIDGILDANEKVNRALIAGAYAVGAQIKIDEIPGYLPMLRNENMDHLFMDNAATLVGEDEIVEGAESTGSFDFGDVSHLMPSLHPFIGGISGNLHTRDFTVVDPDIAYVLPAKIMAMTLIDLLCDGAEKAQAIIDAHEPVMTKESYLAFLEGVSGLIER